MIFFSALRDLRYNVFMPSSYDVIIIGSGPAGIFAALELVKKSGLKILMIEKGSDIDQRGCPMIESQVPCVQCGLCSILCGWGGAGGLNGGQHSAPPVFRGGAEGMTLSTPPFLCPC